jgi:hypothetical protein
MGLASIDARRSANQAMGSGQRHFTFILYCWRPRKVSPPPWAWSSSRVDHDAVP